MIEFLPIFKIYQNVAWFNMVMRGLSDTQERWRGDSASPWNIPHYTGMFADRVPHVDSSLFHWLMDSFTSFIIFLLVPYSYIALNIHECGTELSAFR